VNKADGPHVAEARSAAGELAGALQFLYPHDAPWIPPVTTCSSTTGDGLEDVWAEVARHRTEAVGSGAFDRRRARQRVTWMWSTVEERIVSAFRERDDVRRQAGELERLLREGSITPTLAARRLIELV
jgi:LAO/AO transport system kinase